MSKIDLSYLESIASGDKEFIKEMLELFYKSTYPEIENIEDLSNNKDWDKIVLIAHRIKAPLQILGQTDTYDMIINLEKNAKQRINLEQIDGLIKLIKKNMSEINSEIHNIIELM